MDVFLRAGFNTIGDLKEEGAYAQRIQQAIDILKEKRPQFDDNYWDALARRCCRIIERVKNAQAYPFIPSQYMCTITFDWMEDPVIAPSGISYDRKGLERWINIHHSDPHTRQPLTMDQVYTNRNLKDAIEHYRNNFLRFSIPLTN
ncbi:14437_t:CDS:1 [Gigaspora margarita]|uniref:RING-type E3 ubiquitin transferase n=1 Tax=Gigaspora margarita TaxID=4874 RepID=A0ABN7WY54_GIGMA|nr:14437_t:CDS:1 [Gigaspora margarita]